MCNAWNHDYSCRCGFGGDGHLGRPYGGSFSGYDTRTPAGRQRVYTDSYVNPNARCPVCGAQVYFYQSPYGGRVYFDELGPPWPKHPCTDNRNHSSPLNERDRATLAGLHQRLHGLGLPITFDPRRPLGSPPPEPEADPETFSILFDDGKEALRRGKYITACELFVHALKLQPKAVMCWVDLADAFGQRHAYEEQRYCLKHAYALAVRFKRQRLADNISQRLSVHKKFRLRKPAILEGLEQILGLDESASAQPSPASAPTLPGQWKLFIWMAKGDKPIRWVLFAGTKRREGTAPKNQSAQTALLIALTEGIKATSDLKGASHARLRIGSNSGPLIALAQGKARAYNECDRQLLAAINLACLAIARLEFEVMEGAEIDRLIS